MPARTPLTAQVTRILRTNGVKKDGNYHTMWADWDHLPTVTVSDSTTSTVSNNQAWLAQAANANALTIAHATVLGGRAGITLTSNATAADDSARIHPVANHRLSQIKPTATNWVEIEGSIRTGAAITTAGIYWGLRTTAGIVKAGEVITTGWSADTDQAIFVYDTSAATINGSGAISTANWSTISSVAGVDTGTDLGSSYVVAVSTTYRFKIAIGSDLKPKFYINGALVLSGATAFAGTETFVFVAGVANRATAARALTVRDLRVSLYSTT